MSKYNLIKKNVYVWKWCDTRPSMVTHTRNLCSAFNPSKVHTQQWTHTHREHTPGAVGNHLCCGARGAVGGSVPCSRAPQSWYWGWRECWLFTPPTYNSCRPEYIYHGSVRCDTVVSRFGMFSIRGAGQLFALRCWKYFCFKPWRRANGYQTSTRLHQGTRANFVQDLCLWTS